MRYRLVFRDRAGARFLLDGVKHVARRAARRLVRHDDAVHDDLSRRFEDPPVAGTGVGEPRLPDLTRQRRPSVSCAAADRWHRRSRIPRLQQVLHHVAVADLRAASLPLAERRRVVSSRTARGRCRRPISARLRPDGRRRRPRIARRRKPSVTLSSLGIVRVVDVDRDLRPVEVVAVAQHLVVVAEQVRVATDDLDQADRGELPAIDVALDARPFDLRGDPRPAVPWSTPKRPRTSAQTGSLAGRSGSISLKKRNGTVPPFSKLSIWRSKTTIVEAGAAAPRWRSPARPAA